MKARVKATGEIVEVDFYMETKRGKMFGEVTDSKRLSKPDSTFRRFYRDEIEFLSYEDTPDYWTRLEHQYAGMAMQGIMSNPVGFESIRSTSKDCDKKVAEIAICFAKELVKGLRIERSN